MREPAPLLSQVRQPEVPLSGEEAIGVKGTRGASVDGSRARAVRLPGYVVSVEVILGEDSECLSIRYDAGDGPEPYIPGTLIAPRVVKNHAGLTRGLNSVIGQPGSQHWAEHVASTTPEAVVIQGGERYDEKD